MTKAVALPIMQSGFVAAPGTGVIRPGERRDPFTDYTLNQAFRRNAQEGFYLPEITELHREMLDNTKLLRDPEWNLRVMRAMREAFGPDFTAWVRLQRNQPSVGHAQIRFLMDTVHYLQTGHRTMSRQGHVAALARESGGGGSPTAVGEVLAAFRQTRFGVNQDRPTFCGTSLLPIETERLYLEWLKYPDGVDDLIETLWVVFGCRETTNSFQDKLG